MKYISVTELSTTTRVMAIPKYMKKDGKWYKFSHVETHDCSMLTHINLYTKYEVIKDGELITKLENEEEWY